MKKNWMSILLGTLLLLSLATLLCVNRAKRELTNRLQNVEQRIDSLSNRQWEVQNSIAASVERALQKQAALFDRFGYTTGELDATSLRVPVTFTVAPKTTTPDTELTLSLGGEQVFMQREGDHFTGTLSVGLFDDVTQPTVIQRDGDVSRVETLELWLDLKSELFPSLDADYSGSWSLDHGKGVCRYNGEVRAQESSKTSAAGFERIELLFVVDGVVTQRRAPDRAQAEKSAAQAAPDSPAPRERGSANFTLKENVELPADKTLTLMVEAQDSYGLIHRVVVSEVARDETGERREPERWWHGEEQIYNQAGELLFGEEYVAID